MGDLRASPARTALVVCGIAVGAAALGTVAGARAMMQQSLDEARAAGAPPTARLVTEPIDEAALARLRSVTTLEARRLVSARAIFPDGRRDILVHSIRGSGRLGRVLPERGAWPPPPDELLLERASLDATGLAVGDSIRLELPNGSRRTMRIAGTVHAPDVPSATTSGVLDAYIGSDRLGGATELLVETDALAEVQRLLGGAVLSSSVTERGKFWAQDQVASMVLLLTVLGVVCVLLSCFLVVTVVSSILAAQVRQIGVMKSVGARTSELLRMYLATVAVLGALSLAVAVPIAAAASYLLVEYATGLVNLDVQEFLLPGGALALEVGAALALPLVAALGPVVAGTRMTIREAIGERGTLGAREAGLERLAARLPGLSAAARLAVANAFRSKRRLVLAGSALVLGGVVFVAVMSVRASLAETLDAAGRYRAYDAELVLEKAAPASELERVAASVPGVRVAEAWSQTATADGVTVLGLPPRTTLVHPQLVRGRWLRPGEDDAVVVNTAVRTPPGGRRVVGVVRAILEPPVAYVRDAGAARRVVLLTDGRQGVAEAVERRLKDAGFLVGSVRTAAERREVDEANFGILVSFLLTMGLLIAIVAGLGLAATLGVGVLERAREIGVLRAVGAGDRHVARLVLAESVVVALLAWVVTAPLAFPAGRALADAVGELFLDTSLVHAYSLGGLLVWLALSLVVAVLAGLLPARRASRLTVRDVLAYE